MPHSTQSHLSHADSGSRKPATGPGGGGAGRSRARAHGFTGRRAGTDGPSPAGSLQQRTRRCARAFSQCSKATSDSLPWQERKCYACCTGQGGLQHAFDEVTRTEETALFGNVLRRTCSCSRPWVSECCYVRSSAESKRHWRYVAQSCTHTWSNYRWRAFDSHFANFSWYEWCGCKCSSSWVTKATSTGVSFA